MVKEGIMIEVKIFIPIQNLQKTSLEDREDIDGTKAEELIRLFTEEAEFSHLLCDVADGGGSLEYTVEKKIYPHTIDTPDKNQKSLL